MLPSSSWHLIWYFLRRQKLKMLLMFILALIIGAIPAIDSIMLKYIIDLVEQLDDAKISQLTAALWPWVFAYALWWELINWIWRSYDYIYLKAMPILKAQVIDEFYNHTQYHSMDFFQKRMVGQIASRITEASRSLENVFSTLNEKIVVKFSTIATALVAMFYVNSVFVGIFVIWLSVFCAMSIIFAKKIHHYSLVYARSKVTLSGRIVDAIANINAVRMFSSYKYERQYLSKYTDNMVETDTRMQWFMIKLRYFLGLSCTIMIFAMLYHLMVLRANLTITIGDFVLVVSLCLSVADNVWDLSQDIGDFFEELGVWSQTLTLLQPHLIKDQVNSTKLIAKNCSIEFREVSFSYPQEGLLFTDKNIIIPGGQKVGLVGYSGSGKTTFVNLISRLYEVESGQILIDGQDITKVTQESLRNIISVIPQEPLLFHRSIRENIKYGVVDASDEQMIAAAKKAYIHDVIENLADGYDTMCGERGNNLSGGQRQRVIIARAILKDAPILILDEATSALDTITEKLIQNSLHFLMQQRTVLVVAHRLSTLLHMDRILVFDKGNIVEDGTHQELLRQNGLFAKLWQSQHDGFIND